MQDNQYDAAWPQEQGMNEKEAITKELEELRREIQELKARLSQESSHRASADEILSSRIHMLSAGAH